jgi:hypothetical protein
MMMMMIIVSMIITLICHCCRPYRGVSMEIKRDWNILPVYYIQTTTKKKSIGDRFDPISRLR